MMSMELFLLFTFMVGLFVSSMLIPRIVVISNKKRLFDEPNGRSSHQQPVPRLGGVSFLPGLLLSVAIVMGVRMLFAYDLPAWMEREVVQELLFFFSGLMIMYLIGVADDLRGVSFRHKFLYQILASLLLVAGGIYVNDFHGIFGLHFMPIWIGVPLTILLVVLVINAINLIDGVDGLASGLSAVPLFVFTVWFWHAELYIYAMLAIGMLGTLLPFFIYNVFGQRHKLFMGDTGSLVLGFLIAFLSAKFCMLNVDPQAYGIVGAPIVILSLLFIPIFDAARVFIVRMMHGKSPFEPDRSHIHHKFLDMGFSHKQTMCSLVMASFIFVIVNFALLPVLGITFMFLIDIVVWLGLMQLLHWMGIYLKKRSESELISKGSMGN